MFTASVRNPSFNDGEFATIRSLAGLCLTREYGVGFADKNLRRMLQFAETFPDKEIVVSPIRQLSRTQLLED